MWDVVLIFLALLAAVFAVESRDLTKSIIAFLIMSVFVAIMYYAMGAPYAAVFQLIIYAGAVSVLLAVTLHTIRRRRTA